MTDRDYNQKITEIDTLLNDPTTPLEPARVWTLLAQVSNHDITRLAASRR